MAKNDLIFKISADAATFTKEMAKVEKTTKDVGKAAQEEAKKTQDAEKLTLKQLREKAAEERKLGFEAAKIIASTRTEAEKYADEVENLKKHLKDGRLTQEQFNKAMEGLKKPIGNASESISTAGQVTGHFKGQIAALVHPAALATVAVAAIGKAAKAAYDEFKTFETANKSLTLSLQNLGASTADVAAIRGNANVSLTEATQAYSTLVRASGDVVQSEKDLKTALDMSKKAGVDLATATGALTAARSGSIGSLHELNLLTAQEVALLGQISDPATRAATAIKIVADRTKDASLEMTEYEKSLARTTQQNEALAKSAGGVMDVIGKKASQAWSIFTTGAAVSTVVIGDVLGLLSGPETQQDLQDTTDKYAGMSDEVRKLNEEFDKANENSKSKFTVGKKTAAEEIQEVLDLQREHQKQEKALLDGEIQAALNKQSAIRQEQLDYDLKMLKETDELKREQIRLEKEEYTIKESIKNEDEQKLALDVAREKSAQNLLDIQRKQADLQRKIFNDAEAKWDKEQADLRNAAQKVLNSLMTDGERAVAAYNEELAELQRLLDAKQLSPEQYAQGVEQATQKLAASATNPFIAKAESDFAELEKIGKSAASSLASGFTDFLFDPFNNSMEDMLKNFVTTIGKMVTEALILKAITASFGGIGGGATGAVGAIAGFATGGYVSGPGTGTSDSIPALLSNGEFVIPARSTSYYGLDYLENLRKMKVPKHRRYAEGGLVTASGNRPTGGVQTVNNTSSPTNLSIVNITPESAEDYLSSRAGEKMILNVLSKNSKAIKTIIN